MKKNKEGKGSSYKYTWRKKYYPPFSKRIGHKWFL